MPALIERTARAAFNLGGKPVRAGQVVTIDAIQLKKLAASGCVFESEDDNASVPKADIPALKREDVERVSREAAGQIEAIRQTVIDAQKEADSAIAAHQARANAAGDDAEKAITAHAERVTTAGSDADKAVAEHEERAAKAKAAADEAEKASKAKAK
ncbi:hypothetical protein [Aureimonas mangrovi]|uniref:hypothetical protein n=1 Tax=Aureimonas mangrovi TaxID=2758041 RepID=UPI00163DB51B|nr:hypothetical protein [Aureimonas mangrovi]